MTAAAGRASQAPVHEPAPCALLHAWPPADGFMQRCAPFAHSWPGAQAEQEPRLKPKHIRLLPVCGLERAHMPMSPGGSLTSLRPPFALPFCCCCCFLGGAKAAAIFDAACWSLLRFFAAALPVGGAAAPVGCSARGCDGLEGVEPCLGIMACMKFSLVIASLKAASQGRTAPPLRLIPSLVRSARAIQNSTSASKICPKPTAWKPVMGFLVRAATNFFRRISWFSKASRSATPSPCLDACGRG